MAGIDRPEIPPFGVDLGLNQSGVSVGRLKTVAGGNTVAKKQDVLWRGGGANQGPRSLVSAIIRRGGKDVNVAGNRERVRDAINAGLDGAVVLEVAADLGRDHLDAGSVASPNRETEGMRDGSDAVSDWAILNALINAVGGATWVSLHHGGGVGIGYSYRYVVGYAPGSRRASDCDASGTDGESTLATTRS